MLPFSYLDPTEIYLTFCSPSLVYTRVVQSVSQRIMTYIPNGLAYFSNIPQFETIHPMFVERKDCYSALFTYLVGWHASAVSFPLSDVILAQLACPLSDVMFCIHSGITNLSLYKHCIHHSNFLCGLEDNEGKSVSAARWQHWSQICFATFIK